MRGLERDHVMHIGRLTSLKMRKKLSNTFTDFNPMKRFENGSDVREFRSLDNSRK